MGVAAISFSALYLRENDSGQRIDHLAPALALFHLQALALTLIALPTLLRGLLLARLISPLLLTRLFVALTALGLLLIATLGFCAALLLNFLPISPNLLLSLRAIGLLSSTRRLNFGHGTTSLGG